MIDSVSGISINRGKKNIHNIFYIEIRILLFPSS